MSNISWCNYPSDSSAEQRYTQGDNSTSQNVQTEDEEFNLTEEETEDICRAFTLLDVDGDDAIKVPAMEQLLVSLGRLPFDEELANILSYSGAQYCEETRGLNFRRFKTYLSRQLVHEPSEDELREAFQIFDSDPPTGKLNVKQLRHALKTMGLVLTDDEIDFLYKEEDYWMLDERDTIEYEKLINKLLDKPCNCKFLNC